MAEFAQRLLWAIFAAFLGIGISKMIDSQYYLAGGFLIGAAIIMLLVYSIWVKVHRPCSNNAWVLVLVLEPKVGKRKKHKYAKRNRGKDEGKFIQV